MRLITHEESLIEGHWIVVAGKTEADEAALRIESLVTSHLQLVAVCDGGWSRLFRDPLDSRLWEHTYPQAEIHGGGPPRLAAISPEQACMRYKIEQK